jgi:molybdopterin/thiamine biosynthesis adenylyltransferase
MAAHDPLTWRPRLRDSIIVERDGQELLFIFTASRVVKKFKASDFVMRVLPLLDGSRSVEAIGRTAADGAADATDDVRALLEVLEDENILTAVSDLPTAAARVLGPGPAARYDRQLRLLQDFCDEGLADTDGTMLQQRLGEATVVIVGIGGAGSLAAHFLAAAGVGTLRICDFDTVEQSNLSRQVLYADRDAAHSRLKTDAAARRLREVNPEVQIDSFNRKIGAAADLTDILPGADLVINTADQPSPNQVGEVVSHACWPTVPHIMGAGYAYHIGILGTTIIPGRTACWGCVRAMALADHGRDRAKALIGRRARAGALGPLAGIVASILAWEAIRVLAGLPPALANVWAEVDYWPLQIHTRPVVARPACPDCGGG